MTFTEFLPTLNAILNGIATLLLTAGFAFIKLKEVRPHRVCMIIAFGVSLVFLFFYVLHKVLVRGVHTEFGGEGVWAWIYYPMLLTHIVLAMAIVPLVIVTFVHALKANFERHRRWARWTFPLWYYVSITGVLIYFFLYHWF